jgi:glycosyltransferase involved in cell wall biosynthesis
MTGNMPSSFSPEEYVTLLYRSLLGREPDDHGLVAHSAALRRHGNPTEIVKEFLGSSEYRKRSAIRPLDAAPKAMDAAVSQDPCAFLLEAATHHFRDPAFLKQLSQRDDLFPIRPRQVKTIALYYWRMNNGGTERVTARQAAMWSRMGYKVLLITDQDAQPLNDYDYADVKRYIIPERMMYDHDGKSYQSRGKVLATILRNEQVDLFVTNQWYEISSVWDVLIARSLGIPAIIGWHNSFDAGIHNPEDLGNAYLRYLGYHHATLIAVLSRVDQLWFEGWSSPARLVHNPLTFNALPERTAPLNSQTILWLARAERHQKRIDHVIRMFPLVLAEVPKAKLLIVGDGPDLEWAREYARSLGLGDRIEFAGYTTEVEQYIERAAVHVMTSEFEGYPMVLSEIWSHGVPSVLYDLPHLEYLRSGRGYVAVDQKDVAQLATRVIEILQNTPLRLSLGKQARAVVEDILTIDLRDTWKDIFDHIGEGTSPVTPVHTQSITSSDDEVVSLRILVKMLGDKMLSLHEPNNFDVSLPYLPSQAPSGQPKKKVARKLLRAARFVAAPYAMVRKALNKPQTPASALRMIDLSHVGLGDNLMIWTGLYTLLENGVPLCAPGCVIHVQPILADMCSRIFAQFGLVVQRGQPAKQISPIYSPLPPSGFAEWWGTYLRHDWRMNWVEAVDRQKTFPRHGADNSWHAKVRLSISERLLYRRRSWADAVPSYIGYRVWQPVAARHGIYPTIFLSQMKQSLGSIRRIVAEYVDSFTPEEERIKFTSNAAFPSGKSFQTIPPFVYKKVNDALGGKYFTCYVQNDSAWLNDFSDNSVTTQSLGDIKDTFRIIKYSNNLLTTDSFTSHLAQLLRDDFTLVLSRDMQESIVHPGATPRIVANHPACAPCNYQERYDFDHCVAGYKYCIAFENEAFVRRIVSGFHA